MKQMNNTCVEVLPALLARTKTKTIRKAWYEENDLIKYCPACYEDSEKIRLANDEGIPIKNDEIPFKRHKHDKPPKYQVGDIVEMVWDSDSDCEDFCNLCGSEIVSGHYLPYVCKNDNCEDTQGSFNLNKIAFNKNLGKVRITEVFEVKFMKVAYQHPWGKFEWDTTWTKSRDNENIESLAKQNGFKSAEDMFAYFDENYDLSTPKKFHVYRWGWLKLHA